MNAAQGDGMTALHWAAFQDDFEIAEMLLGAGANVNASTRNGALTPLAMACTNGDPALIEALLKAGADANSTTMSGVTALMRAASSGSVDAVKVLLDHGRGSECEGNLPWTNRVDVCGGGGPRGRYKIAGCAWSRCKHKNQRGGTGSNSPC